MAEKSGKTLFLPSSFFKRCFHGLVEKNLLFRPFFSFFFSRMAVVSKRKNGEGFFHPEWRNGVAVKRRKEEGLLIVEEGNSFS